MKMIELAYITPIQGRNEAIVLPNKSSLSVVGVAKSGSKLCSIFSPKILYDARVLDWIKAKII
jgi:hypothetical protein